jgi:pSer/pThr/pTyr-binding forkhead associated (FHA) protein
MAPERSNDCAESRQLHIIDPGQLDRTVIVRGTTSIGRDDENDIVLASLTVSRCHAVLLCDAAGVLLIDLESTNGTLLNSVRVSPDTPVRLADGDVIQAGQVMMHYTASENTRTLMGPTAGSCLEGIALPSLSHQQL